MHWISLCPYVTVVQLGLHVGPEQLEQGLSQKLLPVCGICSTSWAALSGLRGRGSAWPLRDLNISVQTAESILLFVDIWFKAHHSALDSQ